MPMSARIPVNVAPSRLATAATKLAMALITIHMLSNTSMPEIRQLTFYCMCDSQRYGDVFDMSLAATRLAST